MSTDSDYFLYSNAHYLDMCMCVFQCNNEIPAGRLKYQQKYPNRPLPPEKVFETILHRLHTTGSFHPPLSEPLRLRSGRIRTQVVVDDIDVTATTSTDSVHQVVPNLRRRSLPKSTKRAKKIQKPYILMGAKQIMPSDYGPRVEFCQWYLDQLKENPEFAQKILWSGMATITRDKLINEEYWEYVKFKGKTPNWHINIWAGIIGTKLIGPIFLPKDERLNHLATILTTLENALEELPVTELKDIVYQQGKIPPSFDFNWKNCLDECFPVWIGESGPITWPDCSTDLSPVDYFLWGHLRSYMFEKSCQSEAQMCQKITSTFESIRNTAGLLAKVIKSVRRNATLCIECKGGNFSYLL